MVMNNGNTSLFVQRHFYLAKKTTLSSKLLSSPTTLVTTSITSAQLTKHSRHHCLTTSAGTTALQHLQAPANTLLVSDER